MIIALAAVSGGLALALLIVVVVNLRTRKTSAERLSRVVHRFTGDAASESDSELRPGERGFAKFSLDDWLTHLESVATTAAMTAHMGERDQARWQHAMNQLSVGVVLVDEAGHVCATNALADDVMAARDAVALAGAAVTQLLEGARQGRAEARSVRLTGPPPRVINIAAHPVASEHYGLGAVAVIADETQGARVDEVRRDFVANLSHELRTPVGAIALLADTLSAEDDTDVRDRLVGRIGTEADRISHIIDDLLELSRVELEGSLRAEEVELVPLLAEVAHQFSEHARRSEVTLRPADDTGDASAADAHPLTLQADRGQLLRALGNLVDNAIKYSDPGAVVRLRATPSEEVSADWADAEAVHIGGSSVTSEGDTPTGITTEGDLEQAWVDIVVSDEGIGIPADETERIFERFYRVDKARARATGGTGLGLSIVRHVVANHGGEVLLHTREGVGTTFTLRLPAGAH